MSLAAAAAPAAGGAAAPAAPPPPAGPPLTGMAWWRSIGAPRFVCAPMVDASELPFRLLTREFGATLAYTPMMHARLLVEQPGYAAEHFSTCAADRPLVAQLCGHDPAVVLAAGRALQDRGVDAIDLNFGCPQGIARRGRYGAFLLDEPETVLALVRALAGGLRVPVTAKIRVLASAAATVALARDIEAAGASLLCVHGRTRANMKQAITAADWDVIAAVKAALSIPVLANGSIACADDVAECLARTGADGVMSSEALLENPGLFSRGLATRGPLAGGARADAFALARRYLALAAEANFSHVGIVKGHMFKMLFGALRAFPEHMDALARDAKTLPDIAAVVERAAASCAAAYGAGAGAGALAGAAAARDAARAAAAGDAAAPPLAWADPEYLADPAQPGAWYMRHRPDAFGGLQAPAGARANAKRAREAPAGAAPPGAGGAQEGAAGAQGGAGGAAVI